MSNPILSVCIPTYNRDIYLDTAIESIVNQVKEHKLSDKVEICISDNSSTDKTDEIVSKWLNSDDIKIVYHKNEKNEGADRNFLKAVDISSGSFCWFLSSDDLAIESSIDIIINNILKYNYDIYLYPRKNFTTDVQESYIEKWLNEEFIVDADNIASYISNLNKLGGVFSYISSIVFNRLKWNESIMRNHENIERFIGSQYIHTFVLLGMLKNGCVMKSTNTPIVYNRVGNSSFLEKNNYFKRIVLDYNYLPIANTVFGREIAIEIKKLLNRKNTFPKLLRAKYFIDESEKKDFYKFIKKYDLTSPLLLKTFPNPIIKILLIIYSLLSRAKMLK